MPEAPQNKIERAAMPKAADEESDEVGRDGDRHPPFSDGQTIQQSDDWLEDIDFQECGESDVPTFPEF